MLMVFESKLLVIEFSTIATSIQIFLILHLKFKSDN